MKKVFYIIWIAIFITGALWLYKQFQWPECEKEFIESYYQKIELGQSDQCKGKFFLDEGYSRAPKGYLGCKISEKNVYLDPDRCHLDVAKKTQEITICEKISNYTYCDDGNCETLLGTCFENIAELKKDSEICKKLTKTKIACEDFFSQSIEPNLPVFSTEEYTVFSSDHWFHEALNHKKTFNPTKDEAEKAFRLLKDEFEKQGSNIEKLEEYKIQFLGSYNLDNEKVMIGNGFCTNILTNEKKADWKNEYITVFDGGNCFFQTDINIETSEVVNFRINR